MTSAPTQQRDALTRLHTGLTGRPTPQTVAVDLLQLGACRWLPTDPARELRRLARFAGPSSMPAMWRRHPGLGRAYDAAHTAVDAVLAACGTSGAVPPGTADPTDADDLTAWLTRALILLGLDPDQCGTARRTTTERTRTTWWTDPWDDTGAQHAHTVPIRPRGARGNTGGHTDARARYDAVARRAALPGVSVRTYRRAVRAVLHLQQRTAVLAAERDREAATAYGKARLAHTITLTDFAACERTASFVAYYTSRLGMRTIFTNGAQDRPMDTVAEALLAAALDAPAGRPDVIARVLTRQSVLSRLTPAQQGELLVATYEQLAACSRTLRRAFDPNRDRGHMVVRRGDDSSSWNVASRAFNQARTGWMNLTATLGLGHLVEASCPGKVPALVASDVAHWHTTSGGTEHVDVGVWGNLPLPWDVVLGDADCPVSLVRDVCARHGVDADRSGWTQPYRQAALEAPAVAPELVHGISVSCPQLAGLLRSVGAFSGQATPSELSDSVLV